MKKLLIFLLGFLLALGVLSAFPMQDNDEPAKTDKKEDVTTTVSDDNETTDDDGDVTTDDPAGDNTSSRADEITASLSCTKGVLAINHDARAKEVKSIECVIEGVDSPISLSATQKTIDLKELFGVSSGTHVVSLKIVMRDDSVVTVQEEVDYQVMQTFVCHYDEPENYESATVYYVEGMTWLEALSCSYNSIFYYMEDPGSYVYLFSDEIMIEKVYGNSAYEYYDTVINCDRYFFG